MVKITLVSKSSFRSLSRLETWLGKWDDPPLIWNGGALIPWSIQRVKALKIAHWWCMVIYDTMKIAPFFDYWSLPIYLLLLLNFRLFQAVCCNILVWEHGRKPGHRGIFSAGTAVQCGHFQPNSNEQVGTYQHCVHQSIASPCANAENAHLPSGLSTAALAVEICHWRSECPGFFQGIIRRNSKPPVNHWLMGFNANEKYDPLWYLNIPKMMENNAHSKPLNDRCTVKMRAWSWYHEKSLEARWKKKTIVSGEQPYPD